ncbi:MAG: ATP-dependent helicase, partial [Chloroflexi bacterium]|nr:ATP-dependent helicase [Chloroflexota bacterium]
PISNPQFTNLPIPNLPIPNLQSPIPNPQSPISNLQSPMTFTPRPHQQAILAYPGGTMGVSAVPGSGKTWTLSRLAADIIAEGDLRDDQEVLVVTLVNAAVDNFRQRVGSFLQQRGLLPHVGYRVRTLHGLAHDIVRERPELAGLDSNFQIIDEREINNIRNNIALAWLHANPHTLDEYLNPELDENRRDWVRRDQLPKMVQSIALGFIRTAKDMQLTPDKLRAQLDRLPIPLPLAEMGAAMYADYQRALAYRGAVDFDDLIRLALRALQLDADLLARLRDRWPFVLEDEAQDSSRLQEDILRLLAGEGGNWVRVGDPNQAIYETFTTANPQHLRDFMRECDYPQDLPNSGRSTQSIIELANYLIDWTRTEHPNSEVSDALDKPYIEPVPEGDTQPNPLDRPEEIYLIPTKFGPQGELSAVADSLERWLPDHPGETVAVLVPRNVRGFALLDILQARGIAAVDGLLRSTSTTRFAAGALGNLLNYLADPQNPRKLATVYKVWRRADREDPDLWPEVEATAKGLENLPQVEDFVWPRFERQGLDALDLTATTTEIQERLLTFREYVRRWQGTVLLPVNQIILTLAQDLFTEPAELAIAHKLAVVLRQAEKSHQDWRLPELTGELAVIARNERRFLGFSADDTGFDPDKYKGQVVVATVHKAKGLEWDRVYLMSVNNYDFPSGMAYDRYMPERWFIRDSLNLEAEALAQLEAAFATGDDEWPEEGAPTHAARMEYVRERLRLLYVGITRARKELVITWNTGRKDDLQPALPFVALQGFWGSRV